MRLVHCYSEAFDVLFFLNAQEAVLVWRIINFLREVLADERGAALVEYSVILGILFVVALASIGAVGAWVNGQWSIALGLLP